jgi:hypothetical protein
MKDVVLVGDGHYTSLTLIDPRQTVNTLATLVNTALLPATSGRIAVFDLTR